MAQGVAPTEIEKAAIVAGRASGQTTTQIAKALGLSQPTVRKVLTSDDFKAAIEKAQIGFHNLLPKTLKVYRKRLAKDDLRAASEIAHGLGVLRPHGNDQNVQTIVNVQILQQIEARADEVARELNSWKQLDLPAEQRSTSET